LLSDRIAEAVSFGLGDAPHDLATGCGVGDVMNRSSREPADSTSVVVVVVVVVVGGAVVVGA
jgi:hypothetical protein